MVGENARLSQWLLAWCSMRVGRSAYENQVDMLLSGWSQNSWYAVYWSHKSSGRTAVDVSGTGDEVLAKRSIT